LKEFPQKNILESSIIDPSAERSFYFYGKITPPSIGQYQLPVIFLIYFADQRYHFRNRINRFGPLCRIMHQDRPGKPSLALDLIEELRPVMADRLALNLINLRQIDAQGFIQKESGESF
jgi:CRISPR-associated protein Cas1